MSGELAVRYERVAKGLAAAIFLGMEADSRMRIIVGAIWAEFGSHRTVSWVGFYLLGAGEMTLGPRRDKPACSPIGLHGACGAVARSGRTLVVRDVRELGAAYIACDPLDLSEIVVPVRTRDGQVSGVLDMDSYLTDAFGEIDRCALEKILSNHLADCAVADCGCFDALSERRG